MTIEEKAIAYDEAIRKAKITLGCCDSASIITEHTVYDIFPELAESKDEKIKNRILFSLQKDIMTTKNSGCNTKELEECVAWLEKQGESIKIKKGKNYLCTKTHKYAGLEWIEGVKYYSPEDYSLVNQGCMCYCPKYSKEEHNNFFKEVEYDGCLEKQGEQKPYGQRAECLDCQFNYAGECKGSCAMKRGEQKPTEWSEEDSIRLQRIIDFLWYNRKGDTDTIYQQEQDIDWLKSLGPQNKWKPSEEQMDAFEHFVRGFAESGYASPYENNTKLLYSLLNDLKKLRDE